MASRFQISYDLDPPPRHVVDAGLHLAARYETLATLGGYGQSIRAVDLPDGWMAYIVNLPHAKTIHFVGEGGEAVARPQEEEYIKPGTTVVPILYHYTGISTDQELVTASNEVAELAGYGSDFADLASLKTSTTYFIDNTAWAVHSYELSNAKSYSDVACFKLGIPVDAAIRKVSSDSSKFQGYRCDPKRYTGMLPMVIQLLLGVGRVLPSEVDDDKTDIEYVKDSRAAGHTDNDLQSHGSLTLDEAVDSGLSMSLKYDYRWGRTHGIVWARRTPKINAPFIQSSDPERIWEPFLCEIGTRGVLLMPLPRDGVSFDPSVRDVYLSLNPTLRSAVTDTHALMPASARSLDGVETSELFDFGLDYDLFAQDKLGANSSGHPDIFWVLGGFPTDECFPQDNVELERLINSGVVIRLNHSLLNWFYSNKAVSFDHGWAFTRFTSLMNLFFPVERSMAANVCYEEDSNGYATYSHAVTIEFDIAQVDREYTSLAGAVISSLGLTKFTDIYKATLLTDAQALDILASGSYEDFLNMPCESEWVANINVEINSSGAIGVFVNPYLPECGVAVDYWWRYYKHDFVPDYTYFNEPHTDYDIEGNQYYFAYLYHPTIYKFWDSISNKYVLFNPYHPYALTLQLNPLAPVPGFELTPYKAFFVCDLLCIFGVCNYNYYNYYRFGSTPELDILIPHAYSGFYTCYIDKYVFVSDVRHGHYTVYNYIRDANYNLFSEASATYDYSVVSAILGVNIPNFTPDNGMLSNFIRVIDNIAYTQYTGPGDYYVIDEYTTGCYGGEISDYVFVALDIKDSRSGVVTLNFHDIHIGYKANWMCDLIDKGRHFQLVSVSARCLEVYNSLYIYSCTYEASNIVQVILINSNKRNLTDAARVPAYVEYPYPGRFFVTDSIWPAFVDYLNPLKSPPPVEYFKLHCGGSEEMYIASGIPKEGLPESADVYAPKFFYLEPLENFQAFELKSYIFSRQIPLDSIPFGCFPWHLIGD